jgi:uncharacterized protein (DUF39 family)
MEELEILLADLNICIQAKEEELLKHGNDNVLIKSILKKKYTEIKFFGFNVDCYKRKELLTPIILEKMKKDYARIKTEIENIICL